MDPSGALVPESGNGIRVFVGGIPVDTTQQDLIDAFSFYGKLAAARVLRDGQTGRGRGFGFIVFANEDDAKRCCEVESRPLKDRMVTVRIADPEYGGQPQVKNYNAGAPATNGTRIFIGGMPNCSDQDIADHFKQFGTVLATKVVTDRDTGKPRGFGFCLFSTEAEAERACQQKYQTFLGKKVEVRPADPKPGAQAGADPYAAASSPAAVQQYYSWLMQYQQYYMQYYMQAQALAAQQSSTTEDGETPVVAGAITAPPTAGPTPNLGMPGDAAAAPGAFGTSPMPAMGYPPALTTGYAQTPPSTYPQMPAMPGYGQPQPQVPAAATGYGMPPMGYGEMAAGYPPNFPTEPPMGGYQAIPPVGADVPGPMNNPPQHQYRYQPY